MKNKSWFVMKREYLKVVKTPSFWLATLFFPAFIVVISLVSGYSGAVFEESLKEAAESADRIAIYDETGIISEDFIVEPFERVEDFEATLSRVKDGKVDALFVYQENFIEEGINIYVQDRGIFSIGIFNEIALNLVRQSIIMSLDDPQQISAMVMDLIVEETLYADGIETEFAIEQFIVPGVSVALYFVLVAFSTSYLLFSVSEEKENRVIETVLSIVKPRELILGKLLGQVGVVLTQLFTLLFLAFIGLKLTEGTLPIEIDWSNVEINLGQILLAIFYTATGFLVLANMMIAVASAVPSYKEAQSFSSVFVIASVAPIWFIMSIFAEPSGTLATILSFTPFTAPFILLFRNALGELEMIQAILSVFVLSLYVWGSFYVAFKMFELGSLQFGKNVNLRKIFRL